MTVTSETEVFVGVPDTSEGWIDRAREVSNILAADALARDRAGEPPFREVQLLKDSGLVTLLGPVEFGGGGQRWESAYKVVREIARPTAPSDNCSDTTTCGHGQPDWSEPIRRSPLSRSCTRATDSSSAAR